MQLRDMWSWFEMLAVEKIIKFITYDNAFYWSLCFLEIKVIVIPICYIYRKVNNCIYICPIWFLQVIDPKKSTVKLLGTKVEVNLKKADAGSWASLELSQK